MAYNVQAIVEPTTYEMYDGEPFWVVSMTGVGIGPVSRLESKGAQQNGSTDVGFLLENRLLNIEIFINGASKIATDSHRDTLTEILRPRITPVKWKVTRNDSAIRQIDGYLIGMADMPRVRGQSFGGGQSVIVQLKCNESLWYDPTLQNVPFFVPPDGIAGWQFPLEFPWDQQVGDVIDQTTTISYAGNAASHPIIVITGPADNPLIQNTTTGETLEFSGTVPIGDSWTVTITEDGADVTNEAGESVLEFLTEDSDLGTFHFEPGDNDILVQILTNTTNETSVSLRYYNRYNNL